MDRILIILKKKMAPGLHLPIYWGYFPEYSNMFIGIYSRSQVSVYRTIGPLVMQGESMCNLSLLLKITLPLFRFKIVVIVCTCLVLI